MPSAAASAAPTAIFYTAIASLIVPGLVLSIGILVTFRYLGLPAAWYSSALGAHLSWSLPFGLLIMFAVLGRLNPSYEEAAYDLGASRWQIVKDVVVPIVFPGMIAVALFGFTLSYDEFPRSWLTVGSKNTLPLEIWTMTTNVTSPALYALGTVTTVVSFVVIALALSLDHPHPEKAATRDMNSLHHRDREAVQDRRARRTRGSGEIRLVGITKQFGKSYAVKDINLTIPHGSYCCLLGPSGCGKTTILRMIAGHETPT